MPGRPLHLALTPEQIEEARALKPTRSWPQLAKRYKVSVNQVRYALDATRQRQRAQVRNQRNQRERTRDHQAERERRKAKATALGFRSVYEMNLVRQAQLAAATTTTEHHKRCAWCGQASSTGPAGPDHQKPGRAPAWSPQPVRMVQDP